MGCSTTITITGAAALTEAQLSRAIDRSGLEDAGIRRGPNDEWIIESLSRWAEGESTDLAADISQRFPGSRVDVDETWDSTDADTAGRALTVFTCGERDSRFSQVQGLVPVDLAEAITAVRAGQAGRGDLAAAVSWLVDGLEGTRQLPEPVEEPVRLVSVKICDQWGQEYTELFERIYDFTGVSRPGAGSGSEVDWDDAVQRVGRSAINAIIERWVESAREHGGGEYSFEWMESADAYVIGGWDGTKAVLITVYDDGEGHGVIPLRGLLEDLRFEITATWSDAADM